MGRRTRQGLARIGLSAAIIAAVATPAAVTARGQDDRDEGKRQRFTVVSHDDQGSVTPPDFGSAPAQGQQGAFDAPVTRGGQTVGRTETVVTFTRVTADDVEALISCSVKLTRGIVHFLGAADLTKAAEGVDLPVVGGTGIYEGARGVVRVTMDGPKVTLAFDFKSS